MIKSLRCNRASFRNITFTSGVNVILADRTRERRKKTVETVWANQPS